MERLELDILRASQSPINTVIRRVGEGDKPIPKKVHHHLEVSFDGDVPRHHVEIRAVEEDLAEEFERLTFCDVVGAEDERCVGCEELYRESEVRIQSRYDDEQDTYPLVVRF